MTLHNSILFYQPMEGAVRATGVDSAVPGPGEVVCISFMHNFHAKTSTVEDISPGVQNTTLTINDGLVEVETIQVECHGANTKSSEPDANYWPCCQEEVQ